MKPKIISILNQKGGVGKTTSAINLAAYLAKQGRSVLVVDFDPQGNATSGLGIDSKSLQLTLADALDKNQELGKVIIGTKIKNLSVVPSDARLASSEVELAGKSDREQALKNLLNLVTSYDYVLIDCPPSLGLLTVNALTASNYVLIPVQAEYYALEGLSQLLQVMQNVMGGLNPDLELLGVLVTMYDKRTSLSRQVYADLQQNFGDKMFDTVIPRNVRLAEAPSHGQPISEYDSWSKGARAYKNAAKELLKRSENR